MYIEYNYSISPLTGVELIQFTLSLMVCLSAAPTPNQKENIIGLTHFQIFNDSFPLAKKNE